jgi:hypothetical protein
MAVANTTPAVSDERLMEIAQTIGRMTYLLRAGFRFKEEEVPPNLRGYLQMAQTYVQDSNREPSGPNVIDARRRFVRVRDEEVELIRA